MATLKTNWLLAGLTLAVLFFGVFLFANATEKKTETKKVTTTTWNFTGNNPAQILEAEHWQAGPSSDLSCQSMIQQELPCTYIVDDEEISTPAELVTYFENKYTSNVEDQVVADAQSTREPQP